MPFQEIVDRINPKSIPHIDVNRTCSSWADVYSLCSRQVAHFGRHRIVGNAVQKSWSCVAIGLAHFFVTLCYADEKNAEWLKPSFHFDKACELNSAAEMPNTEDFSNFPALTAFNPSSIVAGGVSPDVVRNDPPAGSTAGVEIEQLDLLPLAQSGTIEVLSGF